MPQPQSKQPDFIPAAPPDFIPADPEPSGPNASQLPPDTADQAWKAAVHGNMLGIDPGTAYRNGEEIDKQLRAVGGDYDDGKIDDSIINDLKVGWESSILGLTHRKALPEQVRDPGMVDKFITGVSQTVADLPAMIAGGIMGGAAGSEVPVVGTAIGAGAGAFALPAAAREALVQGIKHGDVTSFSDILHRMAHVTVAGAKGAAVGAVTTLTGDIPVGSFIAKSGLATTVVKGLYQATAMTTAADLLDGKLPSKDDFAGNAALIVPLNLITHGMAMGHGDVEQATMDVYAKDGKTPENTAATLTAQPPVKPDLPEGLRPAINLGESVIDGDTTENHAELATRTLRTKPVSMEELEADPALADDVLQDPKIHEQAVIDRAWQLKKDTVDRGDVEAPTESVPQKPLYEMSPEEIDAAHTEAAGRDQDDLVDLFGKEGAKRYSALQRKANSSIDMQGADRASEQIQEMESGLTKEQQDRLYGIGDTRHQLEDINEYRSALGRLDDNSPDALSESLKWAVSQIDDPSKPVEEMSPKQQVRYAQLRYAFETAQANGWDTSAIIKKAILSAAERFPDPADAIAVLEKVARSVGESRQTQAALPGEVEQQKPLTIDDLYDRASMKSGRGFVTPDGKFLSRMEARKWMKDNEPDVHEMWTNVAGDKSAELHSEQYAEARNRAQARSVTEGDPVISNVSPQNVSRLAAARTALNKIKAGLTSAKYGREVLRTLFVGQRDARIAATTQLRDSIAKLIPDFHDQEALSILRDYKGTPDKLAADLEQIRNGDSERMKALIPSIERAMNPTPELLEADKRLTGYYTAALNEGRELGIPGISGSTIDPANYSPHILTRILEGEKPSSGVGRPAMAKTTPFGKERSYPTILDALKTGKLDARTVNALDSLSVYGDRHATVVATKILARELANTELGKYGTQDSHPDGWVQMAPNQSVFRNNIPITDAETGEAHVLSQSLYVPKEVADAMRPIIETDVLSHQPGMKGFKAVQSFTKSIELGLSIFHMKALSITAMNNMSFADFTRALASDTKSPEFVQAEREWAADGLQTTKTSTPYEAYQGLKESSIKESFDVRQLPGIKQLDSIAKALTDETFDVIQRKFKVEDAELKSAAWRGKHPDASDEEYFAARRSIAKEVNATYGGLNWEVMGWGKNARELVRMVMLAPDWTFSNVANMKYAGEGGAAGSAARMFWVKSFATGIALTQATSLAVSGQLSDHPTQVYLGKDKDSKPLYSNWYFAGAPKDAITLLSRVQRDGGLSGLAEFLTAKLGPIAATGIGLAENRSGTGKPIYKEKDSNLEKTGKQAEFVGEKVVPFTVDNVAEMLMDGKNHSMMEYVGALAGTYTTHDGAKGGAAKEQVLPGAGRASRGIKLPGQSRSKRFSIRAGR